MMQLAVSVTDCFIICLMSLSGMETVGLPTNDDWVNRTLNSNGKLFFFKSSRRYWRTGRGGWVLGLGWRLICIFWFWGVFCDTLGLVGWSFFSSWDTVQKTVAHNQNSLHLSILSSILKRNQLLVVYTKRFKAFSLK